MSVVYGGMHSIVFIRLSDSTTKHSWSDLHLIPEVRPTIALPEPKVQLIEIPGRSKRIDLTDYMPGGLTYGPRSGEFTFYVDHDQWDGWENAYNELSRFFNGDKFAVYLIDNITELYEGRVYLTEYNPEDSYSTATLHYELEPDVVTDGYIQATFIDSSTYGGTVLQESMLKRNTTPKYYGIFPQHPGYKFNYWTPSLSTISSDTTYTAVYRTVQSYTITFVDWDGTVLKSSVVNEGNKPTPPSYPVRVGYRFVDWDSEIAEANADKTYTATYSKDENYINGVWEDVDRNIKNGTYKTYYKLGDKIYLDITDEYSDYVEIVGIDKDTDADGNLIPLTFITVNQLSTRAPMQSSNDATYDSYRTCVMRMSTIPSIEDAMPSSLKAMLKTSYKYVQASGGILPFTNRVWIPSFYEIYGGDSYETLGVTYHEYYDTIGSRIKMRNGVNADWWLRTYDKYNEPTYYKIVYRDGKVSSSSATSKTVGIVIGFCVGASS